MTKRIILPLILFCLILPVYVYASDEYSDIQIIRSDEKGIVFRYKVPELSSSKYNKGDTLFDILGIDKCPLSKESGYPQVPARIVVIGIPLGSQIDVRVLEGNSLEKGKLNLPRFEERIIKEEGQESRKLQEDIYNKDIFYPEKIVSFDSPTFMRNQRILRLKIFPVQYNPLRKTVKYYSDITIAVDFSRGEMVEGNIEKGLFENIYRETILNYEIAKNWRKTREVGLKKVMQINPFSYSDTWYKITLRDNGIYKLDGNYLANAGINLSSIDPQKIRIFNGGGKVLPLLNKDLRPELKEVAIFVSDGGDNKFDPSDFILFYGWSVNNWDYDSTYGGYKYYLNPYTRENVFWLTVTEAIPGFPELPKRMEIKDGSLLEPDPFISAKSKDRIHMESDVMLYEVDGTPNDYFQWYWKDGNSFTLYQPLSNVLPEDTAVIKVRYTSSNISSIVLNSTPSMIDSTKKDKLFNYITTARSIDLDSGLNTLQINFSYWTYLDYYEIEYWKKLVCSDNQLWFENQDRSEVIEYRIAGFNGTDPYLFEIEDRFGVKKFESLTKNADTMRFQCQNTAGERKQFYLADQSKFKTPISLTLNQMADLRDVSNQADLLVITHSDFYDQLQEYKSLRENLNLKVQIVKVQDIYDEFSWGLFDPVAIRDFLKFAYENWEGQAPAYVLLVGDGTYDYKDLLGTHSPDWIPPFVANPSIINDLSVSDDNFAYFGNYGYLDEDSNGVVDMFIGRWPVKTNQDVQVIINKITDYETTPELNTWRNLITLVADDEFGPPGVINEWEHTVYTESLSKEHIPKSFNLNKIYLMEYPKDVNGKKPEAEEAVVDAFNNGTVIINYMGHGNPNVWAHEYVFKREQDIPRLKNKRRLPLVYVASCSIGNFYNPYAEGMGEEFLRAEEKGAISVISATWLVYATENAMLNYKVYDLLLRSGSQYSISEALYIAKLLRGYNGNDRQYILIGDPLTFLASPELQVRLKDMNPDTLSALSQINFKGEVTDREGNIKTDFNGTANVLAFDSEKLRTHIMPNQDSVKYTLPGNVMFRGNALVQNGEFTGNFIVPKDIGYGGKNAKISAYVVNADSSIDGAGALDSLIVAGTDTTVKDSLGPQISILFEENMKFTDGDTVKPDPTLVVYINDPQGINLTGELGHGITLTVDDDWGNMQDLTSNFQYDLNNYKQGSLIQKLNLKDGEHTLKIKAWDNANNSTLQSFLVKVLSMDKELSITQALNYPNPFAGYTQFTYELSIPANKVEIKIFTLSGRLIKILSGTGSPGFNSGVIWDGRDEDGDKVANGVYIYKIMAETKYSSGGKETTKEAEAIGKAVVMN